ncbi:MAG: hypothetical protein Q8R92_01530 [Deltaproteobacteria bacterium]|nr:hypothetical protein [Deltaproteobacteria bacterium]
MNQRKDDNAFARWIAGLGAAILVGGLAGYFMSSGEPEPTTVVSPSVVAPTADAPPSPQDVPEIVTGEAGAPPTIPPRLAIVPAKPPPLRADLPFARAAPGDEPVPSGDIKSRQREMQRRLDDWGALMEGTRADIRLQLLEGKKQERDRIAKQIDEIDQALTISPGDDEALEARRRLKDELYYTEDAIQRLEEIQEREP